MSDNWSKTFFVLSLIGFGVGYWLTNSIQFGLCVANEVTTDASCINFYERVGDPVFFGAGALALVFLVLLFTPQARSAWKKFAVWFVPLAALVFIFTPEPSGWINITPAPEQVFQYVSLVYVVISLFIIGLVTFSRK
ncbi:MAG: hypothetical protein AAB573_01005 [Patescibacteria group bacterium]